jgi:hypothetical protein
MQPVLNGFVLALLNLTSVLFGYWSSYVIETQRQVPVQVISACIFNIFSFLIWKIICRKYFENLRLRSKKQFVLTFILSFLFGNLLFYLMGYFIQGSKTTTNFFLGLWLYQIPTNIFLLKIYPTFSKFLDAREKFKKSLKIKQL